MTKRLGAYELEWRECWLSEAVASVVGDLGSYEVYVEMMDSSDGFDHVRTVLENFGIPVGNKGKAPIVSRRHLPDSVLDDTRIFPHYDTLWFGERIHPDVTLSPEVSYDAIELVSSDLQKEWLPVFRWMEENGLTGGVITGYGVLTVRRLGEV